MPERPASYVHGHHDSVLRSHRWRTAENSAAYLLPRLSSGDCLLDVGCGPGTLTVGLAGHVGQVLGVDAAEGILDEARAEAERSERANVSFEGGDVYHLAFDDGAFDVVHAHQVLQHLADPVAALVEMGRVCRPGGLVAARDGDYGGMLWYPEDADMDKWRTLYRQVARACGGEPDAGRRLGGWARAAGFEDVQASASVWCFATPAERSWWAESWAERVTSSRFADQATGLGLARASDLERCSQAWRRWASSDDACFFAPHGEILCLR